MCDYMHQWKWGIPNTVSCGAKVLKSFCAPLAPKFTYKKRSGAKLGCGVVDSPRTHKQLCINKQLHIAGHHVFDECILVQPLVCRYHTVKLLKLNLRVLSDEFEMGSFQKNIDKKCQRAAHILWHLVTNLAGTKNLGTWGLTWQEKIKLYILKPRSNWLLSQRFIS
jgi:hypothetical protein